MLPDMPKPPGYVSGQFGKNRLGDRNEFLPTVYGFDEFYGNLYRLKTEAVPEKPDYPAFRAEFGPRGVLECKATETMCDVVDDRFGPMGMQDCEDTGPLPSERMKTTDKEFPARAMGFIKTNTQAGQPWFAWLPTSQMDFYTHVKDESKGVTGCACLPMVWSNMMAMSGRFWTCWMTWHHRKHHRPIHRGQRPALQRMARRGA